LFFAYWSEKEATRQLIVNSLSSEEKGATFQSRKTHQDVGCAEQEIHQDFVLP